MRHETTNHVKGFVIPIQLEMGEVVWYGMVWMLILKKKIKMLLEDVKKFTEHKYDPAMKEVLVKTLIKHFLLGAK